jgi:hypothetical protein
MSSDDQGQLWLSTDENPNNKALIATEPEWNASRDWVGTARRNFSAPENRSAPIHLEAGHRYYVEALEKEEGGGDNLAVTAIKEGDPLPENGAPPLQGAFIGTFGVPTTNTVAFTTQPSNALATVGRTATFSVVANSSSSPIVYQWQKNEVNIFQATASIYVTPPVTAGDNLARYRCIAYLSGGASATSAVATLTVDADVFAPQVLRVHALGDPVTGETTRITVFFDEPVGQSTAEDPYSYQVDDGVTVSVTLATLLPNLRMVVLTTDNPISEASGFHTLTVQNVTDRSPSQNQMQPVTKPFRVTHLVAHYPFDNVNNLGADVAGGNDGLLLGGPTPGPGKLGGALTFDNVDDYVIVSNSPTFGVTGDITLTAWVKRENLSQYAAIIAKTDGANTWDFDLYFDDETGALSFYSDGTGPQAATSTGQVPDTGWHHVAVTRSGSALNFYIDGADAGASAASGGLPNNPSPLRIGTDGPAWDSKSMFHGSIDDVRIYNRGLSAAEIQMVMLGPALRIVRSENAVEIYWPAAASEFVLESTDSLSPANWTPITDVPQPAGAENMVRLTVGSGKRFYRLKE